MKSTHGRTTRRLLAIGGVVSAATAGISCSSPSIGPALQPQTVQTESVTSAPTSQPMTAHWIQDQRLRALMTELNKHNPAWPAGLPQEPESPAASTQPYEFDEIAALANALADEADHLPAIVGQVTMSQADRAGFLAEARTLHEQATALQSAANRRSIEQMQRQMDGINATCVSCHSRYRDFSGLLNRTQASLD